MVECSEWEELRKWSFKWNNKVMKWSDGSDNGEVLIKFVCIIYFDDFIRIIGTQIQ